MILSNVSVKMGGECQIDGERKIEDVLMDAIGRRTGVCVATVE